MRWITGWKKIAEYLGIPTSRVLALYRGKEIEVSRGPTGKPVCFSDYLDTWLNPTSDNTRLFVYFLETEDEKFLKVGISNNPKIRMKAIQDSCPIKLNLIGFFPGGMKTETLIQRELRRFKIRAEWFEHNEITKNYVKKCLRKKKVFFSNSSLKLHAKLPFEPFDPSI